MARQGGKRGRKTGRKTRQEAFKRYWGSQKGYKNRREMHKERNVLRHETMVEESRARHSRISNPEG